jgi:hypothetical protein
MEDAQHRLDPTCSELAIDDAALHICIYASDRRERCCVYLHPAPFYCSLFRCVSIVGITEGEVALDHGGFKKRMRTPWLPSEMGRCVMWASESEPSTCLPLQIINSTEYLIL